MAWVLITPSSRGLGHALTRHLLLTTPPTLPLVATCRTSPSSLRASLLADLNLPPQSASRLDIQACDLTSPQSIQDLSSYCASRYNDRAKNPDAHLRLALCTPGMLVPERAPEKIDPEGALQTLRLNLLAPMLLAKHFVGMLPKGKGNGKSGKEEAGLEKVEGLNPKLAVLAFMSARVGSISDNALGGWYSYRSSKAGVNQLVRSLDIYLGMLGGGGGSGGKGKEKGKSMCVGLHPGTVKTDLSREFWGSTPPEKLFEPGYSAEKLMGVVRRFERGMGGRCWDWKGEEILP